MVDFVDWSSVLFLVFSLLAVVFAFLLSRESSHEKYWVFFVLGSLALVAWSILENFLVSVFDVGFQSLLLDVFQVMTAFCFAYAFFGLYSGMKQVRKKVSEKFD
ncbi:MAG: hypothetical protein Q7S92_03580 [Candidatus Diapherotrites archaeon]|nr:hypothetical protein [Candidatus Diapherotrites archaeon]